MALSFRIRNSVRPSKIPGAADLGVEPTDRVNLDHRPVPGLRRDPRGNACRPPHPRRRINGAPTTVGASVVFLLTSATRSSDGESWLIRNRHDRAYRRRYRMVLTRSTPTLLAPLCWWTRPIPMPCAPSSPEMARYFLGMTTETKRCKELHSLGLRCQLVEDHATMHLARLERRNILWGAYRPPPESGYPIVPEPSREQDT